MVGQCPTFRTETSLWVECWRGGILRLDLLLLTKTNNIEFLFYVVNPQSREWRHLWYSSVLIEDKTENSNRHSDRTSTGLARLDLSLEAADLKSSCHVFTLIFANIRARAV